MKVVFGLFFVFVCAVANAKPADDHYTTKYDNVDIEPIIKNDRLLRGYVDCLLGIKHCNKDGEELKKVIPDALKTSCSKCNQVQQMKVRKMMHHLIEKKHDWYKELEAKYDPEGIFRRKYNEQAKKEGLKL